MEASSNEAEQPQLKHVTHPVFKNCTDKTTIEMSIQSLFADELSGLISGLQLMTEC